MTWLEWLGHCLSCVNKALSIFAFFRQGSLRLLLDEKSLSALAQS